MGKGRKKEIEAYANGIGEGGAETGRELLGGGHLEEGGTSPLPSHLKQHLSLSLLSLSPLSPLSLPCLNVYVIIGESISAFSVLYCSALFTVRFYVVDIGYMSFYLLNDGLFFFFF